MTAAEALAVPGMPRAIEAEISAGLYPTARHPIVAPVYEGPRWTRRALRHFALVVEEVLAAGEDVRVIHQPRGA